MTAESAFSTPAAASRIKMHPEPGTIIEKVWGEVSAIHTKPLGQIIPRIYPRNCGKEARGESTGTERKS